MICTVFGLMQCLSFMSLPGYISCLTLMSGSFKLLGRETWSSSVMGFIVGIDGKNKDNKNLSDRILRSIICKCLFICIYLFICNGRANGLTATLGQGLGKEELIQDVESIVSLMSSWVSRSLFLSLSCLSFLLDYLYLALQLLCKSWFFFAAFTP